jgi:dolichol kinase
LGISFTARRAAIIHRIQNSQTPKIRRDFWRKLNHIIFFLIAFYFVVLVVSLTLHWFPDVDDAPLRIWEYSENIFEMMVIFENPATYYNIGVVHHTMAIALSVTLTIVTFVDTTRRFPGWCFPLSNFMTRLCREAEVAGRQSALVMVAGFTLAAIVLPPIPIFAILGAAVFGDAAASQVGMRVGTHKIAWNPEKSWEGLAAGTFSSLIAIAVAGPIYGVVAALAFALVDAVTERPVRVSDNLLLPLVTAAAFFGLYLLGINYIPPAFILGA